MHESSVSASGFVAPCWLEHDGNVCGQPTQMETSEQSIAFTQDGSFPQAMTASRQFLQAHRS